MKWQFDLASDIGGRTEQQDRMVVLEVTGQQCEYLVVLADGMGGQQQGAVAAQAVIDTARAALPGLTHLDPKQFLTELCVKAHDSIREIGQRNDTNPASTCTALYVKGEEAYWIHVGDSRLCHFNGERLLLRSYDHTVSELLKRGEQTPGQYEETDNRLYMCLGGQNELEPEYGASAVGDDDWFMLCSDGFWSQVGSDEVAQRLLCPEAEPITASGFAAMAKERAGEGGDNLSLALVRPNRIVEKKPWWRPF